MTESNPRSGRAAARTTAVLAVLCLVACGAAVWFCLAAERRLRSVEETVSRELGRVEATLQLLRLEGDSAGRGVEALIEQIRYFAPHVALGSTPDPMVRRLQERLDEALRAVEVLGKDAFDTLVAAIAGEEQDEVRRWLLRAAHRSDPERGKTLLARVVRGTALDPSPRLRFFAADELFALDRELCGETLRTVLEVESARGVTRQPSPKFAPEYERVIGTNHFPEFFNFVGRFVATGHPEVEDVLLMMIGREEHDLITYKTAIEHLGRLGSERAAPRIRHLFDHPPGRVLDPLFLNTCLQAIAEIEGAAACTWFREKLRTAEHEFVVRKLQSLTKELCGAVHR